MKEKKFFVLLRDTKLGINLDWFDCLESELENYVNQLKENSAYDSDCEILITKIN